MKKFLIPSAEVLDNHLKNSPVDDSSKDGYEV